MHRAGIAVALTAATIALGASGLAADTYRHGDFLQFWLEPRALLVAASPYDVSWWADMHRQLGVAPLFDRAVYPPYDAILFLPLGVLPLPYAAAVWIVAQLAAVAAVAVAIARRLPDRADRVVFLAVVLTLQPLWLLVVGGNVTGFLFAALGMGYLAALDGRMVQAGAFLGLLAAKPHPFVFLGVAALVAAAPRERPRVVLGVLATAGTLAFVTLALHPDWYADWIPSALGLQATIGSNATAWTAGRVVGIASVAPGIVLAAAVAAAYVAWAVRTRPPLAIALPAAIPVSLAVAPHGWSYDQLLLLVPIGVILGRVSELERPRRAATVAFAFACVAVPWILYVLAFRRGGEELSVITPIAVFAAFVATAPRREDQKSATALVPSRV